MASSRSTRRSSRTGRAALALLLALSAGALSCTSRPPADPPDAASPAGNEDASSSERDGTTDATVEVEGATIVADAVRCYGNPWGADVLTNLRVGIYNWGWAYRFKPQHSGNLAGVRVYWVDNSAGRPDQGYAGGNGGQIEVAVRSDAGGRPNLGAAPLATHVKTFPTMAAGTISPRDTPDKREQLFSVMPLSNAVPVQAGGTYHISFTNVGPSPTTDYASINVLQVSTGQRNRCQPGADAWGITHYTAGSGQAPTEFSNDRGLAMLPIMELVYDDGTVEGTGYLESWVAAERPVQAGQRVRQVFTPDEDLALQAVGVRLSGNGSGGAVAVELKQDGAVIAAAPIPASTFAGGYGSWAEAPLAIALTAGQTYTLELSALDGANVLARPMLDGSAFWGFSPQSTWGEGYAQSSVDDGASWLGWHAQNQTDLAHAQGDLQLYFVLGDSAPAPTIPPAPGPTPDQPAVATPEPSGDGNLEPTAVDVETVSDIPGGTAKGSGMVGFFSRIGL